MKFSPLIVILLIVFLFATILPISADAVPAITDITVTSPNAANGFVSQNFQITVHFSGDVSSVNINDINIKLEYSSYTGTLHPDSCSGDECSVTTSVNQPGVYTIDANARIRGTDENAPNPIQVVADMGKPIIQLLSYRSVNGHNTVFADIRDPSQNSAPGSVGVGIGSIIIRNATNVFSTEDVSSQQTDQSNVLHYSKQADIPLVNGKASFELIAIDKSGNKNTKAFNAVYDSQAPVVESLNGNENNLYVSSNSMIHVHARIKENKGINVQNTKLVLMDTRFNTIALSASPTGCTHSGEEYTCYFAFQEPQYSSDPFTLSINAYDLYGNSGSKAIPNVHITHEFYAPQLTKISSNAPGYHNDAYLAGNSFFAEFDERGSGMDPSSVTLQAAPNSGSPIMLSAQRCEQGISNTQDYKCYFVLSESQAKLLGSSFTATLKSASDYAGNAFTGSNTYTIFIDNSPPNADSITINQGGSSSSSDTAYYSAGSAVPLKLTMNFEEEQSRIGTITINITHTDGTPYKTIIKSAGDACADSSGENVCTVILNPLDGNVIIEASVADLAGNNLSFERTLIPAGSAGQGFDQWELGKISVSPDIYFTGLNSQFQAKINLIKIPAPYEKSLAGASAKCEVTSGTDVTLKNVDSYSQDNNVFITGYAYKKSGGGSVGIKCMLNLTTEVSGSIYDTPQTLEADFTLNPYSQGDYPNDPAAVLQGAKNNPFTGQTAIGIINKADNLVTTGETFCNIQQLCEGGAASINGVAQFVAAAIPAAHSVTSVCNNLQKAGDKFCAYVSCNSKASQSVQKFYSNLEGQVTQYTKYAGIPETQKSIKNSLVLSAVTGCVPGIIDNVKEIQNINCGFNLCLVHANNGEFPAGYCNYVASNAVCTYTGSQVLQLVPFADVAQQVFGTIGNILQHPLSALPGLAISIGSQFLPATELVISLKKIVAIALNIIAPPAKSNGMSYTNYCSDWSNYLSSTSSS